MILQNNYNTIKNYGYIKVYEKMLLERETSHFTIKIMCNLGGLFSRHFRNFLDPEVNRIIPTENNICFF